MPLNCFINPIQDILGRSIQLQGGELFKINNLKKLNNPY